MRFLNYGWLINQEPHQLRSYQRYFLSILIFPNQNAKTNEVLLFGRMGSYKIDLKAVVTLISYAQIGYFLN